MLFFVSLSTKLIYWYACCPASELVAATRANQLLSGTETPAHVGSTPPERGRQTVSLFLALPIGTAVVLAVHIWLRLSNRGQYKITLCILLVGLSVIAVVPFFAPGILDVRPHSPATNPMVEGLNRRLLAPSLFAIEAVALLVVIGALEAVMAVILKRRLGRVSQILVS